jgi:hypothetical protein
MTWRHFKCEVCGHEISSFSKIEDSRNICQICRWLDANAHLTNEEREKLRQKLCHDRS